jgi:hypothetical protein
LPCSFLLLAWLAGYRLLRWLLGDPAKLLAEPGNLPGLPCCLTWLLLCGQVCCR